MEDHGTGHGPTSWLLQLPLLPHDYHYIHVNGAIVIFLFLTVVSLVIYFALKGRQKEYLIPPKKLTLVNGADILVGGLYDMVTDTLGKEGAKHFPFIAAIFIFVFFSNLMGLLPHGGAPTSNINTTLGLGLVCFVYYNIMGIKAHGFVGYLKHFLMGLGPAGVVVALLELLSHAIRPVSLGVRLFVNMFVDHAVVGTFQSLVAFVVPVPLLIFGVVICTIQAFVFAILTAVYVQMATEHDH